MLVVTVLEKVLFSTRSIDSLSFFLFAPGRNTGYLSTEKQKHYSSIILFYGDALEGGIPLKNCLLLAFPSNYILIFSPAKKTRGRISSRTGAMLL